MYCTTIRKLAEVLSGEERLMKLLGTNPCKCRLSESQLLLVVQHVGSLEAYEEVGNGPVRPKFGNVLMKFNISNVFILHPWGRMCV
jgi:hypothetical protein